MPAIKAPDRISRAAMANWKLAGVRGEVDGDVVECLTGAGASPGKERHDRAEAAVHHEAEHDLGAGALHESG
jgi:hypothetical protein